MNAHRKLTFAIAIPIVLAVSPMLGAEAAEKHIMINAGDMKWSKGPASLPPGAQVVLLEGDPAKAVPITLRLKFPAGYKVPPHTHPAIEHITVLSGTFHMGAGEKFDTANGMAISTGGFAVMPEGMPHFAWTEEEAVVQLHSVGPWGITYVDPKDDPRASN